MKRTCSQCWDPVDREGDVICGWCAMTPAERRRAGRRANIICVVVLVTYCALIFFLASGKAPP